jgi:hypothetical protein
MALNAILSHIYKREADPQSPQAAIEASVTDLTARVKALYGELHGIVIRHEGTIGQRLQKMNKSKRKNLLLKCWPNMAAAHRPASF